MDGAKIVVSSREPATARSAKALARKNRVRWNGSAPIAEKKTNRSTPAASAARSRRAVPREVAERELDVDPVATEPARVPHQRPHGLSGVQEQGQQSVADRPCGP